jgi:hypothetical protein
MTTHSALVITAVAPETSVTETRSKKPATRHLITAGRVGMGLVFFVCGLNGFLNFLPVPSDPPPHGAMAFAGALMGAGYMFPLIKGTEVLASLLLLSNRFVPLALAIIAPVVVNIVAFHAFLAPSGLGLALVLAALNVALAWAHRSAFRPMLRMRAEGAAG